MAPLKVGEAPRAWAEEAAKLRGLLCVESFLLGPVAAWRNPRRTAG